MSIKSFVYFFFASFRDRYKYEAHSTNPAPISHEVCDINYQFHMESLNIDTRAITESRRQFRILLNLMNTRRNHTAPDD